MTQPDFKTVEVPVKEADTPVVEETKIEPVAEVKAAVAGAETGAEKGVEVAETVSENKEVERLLGLQKNLLRRARQFLI